MRVCQSNTIKLPRQVQALMTSKGRRPWATNSITCAILLKCFPMRPPLYWQIYSALRLGTFKPFLFMEERRTRKVCILWAFSIMCTDCPQKYLMTPRRIVCKISTGVSMCGSIPDNLSEITIKKWLAHYQASAKWADWWACLACFPLTASWVPEQV